MKITLVLMAFFAVPLASAKPETKKAGTSYKQDFSSESFGSASKTFSALVGNWEIAEEGQNKVLMVNGKKWKEGEASAGVADKARAIFGERYAEFLDNVKNFAYFPVTVATEVKEFKSGIISIRFKGIDGRVDQAAGIVFNLKENGDYLTVRANPLENNLVLWKFIKGRRSSEKWIKKVDTPTKTWHELKVEISGAKILGYLNGKLVLEHEWKEPISGRVGLWSKADSVVYFDDFVVQHKQ